VQEIAKLNTGGMADGQNRRNAEGKIAEMAQ
jgi:hypothetical protein